MKEGDKEEGDEMGTSGKTGEVGRHETVGRQGKQLLSSSWKGISWYSQKCCADVTNV